MSKDTAVLHVTGGQLVKGTIQVAGAKNAALKMIAATLLTEEEVVLSNVPDIEEVHIAVSILEALGATVEHPQSAMYRIRCRTITTSDIPDELARRSRSSILFVAPLIARTGGASLPHPGGCIIGKRPIDMFIEGFEALGIEITEDEERYHFSAEKLSGGTHVFPWVVHTPTESMLLGAVLAQGTTTIHNAALEPEVVQLAEMLNAMGARIENVGQHTVVIHGVEQLGGTEVEVIPDRLETGTFAILGSLLAEELTITGANPDHLNVFWAVLKRAGADFDIEGDTVVVRKAKSLRGIEVRTHEYPGFPTDLQPPFTVMLTQAEGVSLVHETIFEKRLFYTDKLGKMGAKIIMADPHRVIIVGPQQLYRATLESPDIRAGIALVIAAMCAKGESVKQNVYQIDRGYERIEERLRSIGASIERREA